MQFPNGKNNLNKKERKPKILTNSLSHLKMLDINLTMLREKK